MQLLAMLVLKLQLHWNEHNAVFLGTCANDTKPKAFINWDGKLTRTNRETFFVSHGQGIDLCALPEFCGHPFAMKLRRYKKMMNMRRVAHRDGTGDDLAHEPNEVVEIWVIDIACDRRWGNGCQKPRGDFTGSA